MSRPVIVGQSASQLVTWVSIAVRLLYSISAFVRENTAGRAINVIVSFCQSRFVSLPSVRWLMPFAKLSYSFKAPPPPPPLLSIIVVSVSIPHPTSIVVLDVGRLKGGRPTTIYTVNTIVVVVVVVIG